jgi:hypothetical protein
MMPNEEKANYEFCGTLGEKLLGRISESAAPNQSVMRAGRAI